MPLNRPVAVIGSAIHYAGPDDGAALEERLHAATMAALADAGLAIDDIDGIVVGCNDQVDGRAISVMMASGSVGGVDRDILSTPSAGEHAFMMGALRVASGQYETQLVLAWGACEASSLAEVERLAADPYFHRRLPLDDLSSYAMQAGALLAREPAAGKAAGALADHDRRQGGKAYPKVMADAPAHTGGAKAPARWPLQPGDCAPPVPGVVALVLASDAHVKRAGNAAAWVRGMGWATEAAFLGDRDLTKADALDAAAKQALGDAGLASAGDVDVIEVCGATPYQSLIALGTLGIGSISAWAAAGAGNGAPVKAALDPSGGLAAANAVFCAGLARIAEAANQVRGRAGAHQVAGARRALAHAASGPAAMYQSVVVFDRAA